MQLHNIPRSPFADDDGSADPDLVAALSHWAEHREDPGAQDAVVALLTDARLLVPVVAVLGEAETGPDGLKREKSSEMAVLTLERPGGRRTLPVFSSTEALLRWRPDARPVAVTPQQALQAAVQEGVGSLVLDLAGPVPYEIAGRALRALATGGAPVDGPEVAGAVRALLAAEPGVVAAQLVPGGETDGTLAVVFDAGAGSREEVTRLASALAADTVLRSRLVRGLQVAVLPAGTALPGGEPLYRRPAR
ncbi:SseB family protein [Streptomyces bohaiensis]|uniref:SseB family protein n=1 Tax=Streptomyces bohaiensis TaxID=1431344 RepID=A0ABX1CJX1_9ACTN|nr:SseB family protein [Streptomyces bohaiensis]NJQ17437.1 SseB family protein [Streptomyces bohaiensis]